MYMKFFSSLYVGLIFVRLSVGTWRNYVVEVEKNWCKVRKDVPIEYAATTFINPCTALRMLEDFVPLNGGQLHQIFTK